MPKRVSHEDQVASEAEKAFKSAETRDTISKQITETERALTDAKTKKLRALRLAKERADLPGKRR